MGMLMNGPFRVLRHWCVAFNWSNLIHEPHKGVPLRKTFSLISFAITIGETYMGKGIHLKYKRARPVQHPTSGRFSFYRHQFYPPTGQIKKSCARTDVIWSRCASNVWSSSLFTFGLLKCRKVIDVRSFPRMISPCTPDTSPIEQLVGARMPD